MRWVVPIDPRGPALLLLLAACGPIDEELGYLAEESGTRRDMLERALWRPDLPYSTKLLDSYALGDRGWDLLPLIEDRELADPITEEEWLALGRDTFFFYPLRSDGYVEWLADHPERWEEAGIETRDDGSLIGLVLHRDAAGRERTAITCALCHASGDRAGFASRSIDLGLARALHLESQGESDPRFLGWGPGRIDVTEDGVDGPTSIPDLFGVRSAEYINASGVLAQDPGSHATLAVRFETQYIQGHDLERRPDRRRMWALARFVHSLEEQRTIDPQQEGWRAFSRSCARCHDRARAFSGGLIPAEMLTSDPTVAHTPERGTGFYKVPSLIGIGRGAPYLHDGAAASLRELLMNGHPTGAPPPASDLDALLSVLEQL